MLIHDGIYGTCDLTEPVLVELVISAPVQRLKRIAQHGLPEPFLHVRGFTRYEHSAGVMLGLRGLGASVEEQAAGLLHDVSHTAFSHLVDWVIGNKEKEDFQDNRHRDVIFGTGIAAILGRHGLDPERVCETKNYSLLDNHAPELCMDRFDYALRDFQYWLDPSLVAVCMDGVTTYGGRMVFKDFKSASAYARGYARLQREHWAGPENLMRCHLMSCALKTALDERTITRDDLLVDDEHVLGKLRASKNEKVQSALEVLASKRLRLEAAPDGIHLTKKFRWIDPTFLSDGEVVRVSRADPAYAELLVQERAANEKGSRLRLIRQDRATRASQEDRPQYRTGR